jgi:Family of unknown function (DUF6069)
MTSSQRTAPVHRRPWGRRPLWQVGSGAALVAAVAGIMVYVVARAAGVPMELTEVFETTYARMPMMNMAWAALLEGGVAGTALAAACRRWTTRPRRYFLTLSLTGLTASFAFPLTSDAGTATKIVLSIGHLVVAAIIVPALTLALPRDTARPDNADAIGG